MSTKLILTIGLAGVICTGAAAENYDFYAATQYPGAKLRGGVDLYKVKQTGKEDPKAYQRREVKWWPRKGVDIIEVKPGMPLRTWKLRRQHIPTGQATEIKAHLVAFRGMGNTTIDEHPRHGVHIEPGVVLRLADGRKRCFVRGSFGDEDKKYIMNLYLKEMKRIGAGIDKTKRIKKANADLRWPNNAKPGQPGTMQVESEHFIWISGSQAGSDGDPWVNAKAPDRTKAYRDGTVKCAEFWWNLNEYAGNLMPYWDRKEKYKYEITVAGTKRDGHKFISGYAGGGYGGCILKGAVGGPWSAGLWHEWGHGSLPNSIRSGGGEAQADMHQCLADPGIIKGNHHVKSPWRNVFNASMGYGYTMFYNITCDDPNWGYAWFTCLPHGVEELTMLQTVARVGQQRGLFANGIRGLGDMVGEYAARLATFDCELEDLFRRRYHAPGRSWLETVDEKNRIYRIPWAEAPEPYGANIVRLVADESGRYLVVDFRGLHDPDFYSDWRACIVAVGKDGKRRYSPMWNKGEMTMKRLAGDRAYWLTVAATPAAMYTGQDTGTFNSGRHAFRYPWSVQLSGCKPGAPRHIRGRIDLTKGFKRHANGGGWVADSAKVAPTACIGPDAMVLGSAQVSDNAIVEDYAVVTDQAVVSEHGRVSGRAVVSGKAKVAGYSRTWSSLGKDEVAGVLPKRLGAEALNKFALWANYAMDRQENTILEDWYRFAYGSDRRYGRYLGVNLSGYLYGQPEFVIDGERRGFRFNGKEQYGELCPRAADLGEITVEVTVKWEGQGAQTIFDFGSSPDNCLVLRTAQNGKPGLVAKVGGKTVIALAGDKALQKNAWVSLRVEINGKKASLWRDGKKVAEKASSFRACDAFPDGKVKRNFVATSRDGSGRFKGVIDRVVVYHAVHEDFSNVPAPIRDAPIRPTAEVVATLEKALGNVEEMNKKISALTKKISEPYGKFKARQEARGKELEKRSPELEAAKANLKAVEAAVGKRRNEAGSAFDKLPETLKARAEIQKLRKAKDKSAGAKDRALRVKRDLYITKQSADMVRKVAAAKTAVTEASDQAMAPYWPEKLWMGSFAYQAYRGYYNTNYRHYIGRHARRQIGGGEPRDNVGFLKRLQKAHESSDDWSTTIDWDWRMRQEVDGAIKDLPLMQKWIKRIRGPVVTEKPATVK